LQEQLSYSWKSLHKYCTRLLNLQEHVVHSMQNSCINYYTQTNILLKLLILIIIWISIILLFQFIWDFICSAIIHVCLQWWPRWNFCVLSTAP
jgi:hypothetical protein